MLIEPRIHGVMSTSRGFVSLKPGVLVELPDRDAQALLDSGAAVEPKRRKPAVPKGMETKGGDDGTTAAVRPSGG